MTLPDSQERYPPQDLIDQWVAAWSADIDSDEPIAEVIARKACDWQREQDAQACIQIAFGFQVEDGTYHAGKKAGAFACAESLRSTPPQPGAAQ